MAGSPGRSVAPLLLGIWLILSSVGCATAPSKARGPAAPPGQEPSASPAPPEAGGAPAAAEPGSAAPQAAAEVATAPRHPARPGPNPCRQSAPEGAPAIDDAHRKLYETLCGAALWFDGLFGERNNVSIATARGTSGRLEISALYSQYEGTKVRLRGNVRFDFPNFDKRWNAFIGRDDEDDFIRDRSEGLALRSQFLDFADENRWLAGLGYSLPGTYKQRTDFRVGGKLGREPEIFAQGRYRRNFLINERNLVHFRETIFWTNRDGFGGTTSLDYDHVVTRQMLLRWGNVGTVSQSTDGLEWRSALLLYQSLERGRALAYEVFVRGETAWEVPLKEYGAKSIYRQPLLGRDWLAGEFVLGYSWPRFEIEDRREGSISVGLGLEILVGNWK